MGRGRRTGPPEKLISQMGGLEVGTVEVEEHDVDENPYDVFNSAVAELEAKGIKLSLDPPKRELPPMPKDPLDLGTGLFSYYGEVLEHWRFTARVGAEVSARLITLVGALSYRKSLLKKKGLDPHEIELDKEYIRWNTQIVRLKAQQEMLETERTAYHRKMAHLSRSVVGMETEVHFSGRGENMGRRPRGQRGGLQGDL